MKVVLKGNVPEELARPLSTAVLAYFDANKAIASFPGLVLEVDGKKVTGHYLAQRVHYTITFVVESIDGATANVAAPKRERKLSAKLRMKAKRGARGIKVRGVVPTPEPEHTGAGKSTDKPKRAPRKRAPKKTAAKAGAQKRTAKANAAPRKSAPRRK